MIYQTIESINKDIELNKTEEHIIQVWTAWIWIEGVATCSLRFFWSMQYLVLRIAMRDAHKVIESMTSHEILEISIRENYEDCLKIRFIGIFLICNAIAC